MKIDPKKQFIVQYKRRDPDHVDFSVWWRETVPPEDVRKAVTRMLDDALSGKYHAEHYQPGYGFAVCTTTSKPKKRRKKP